MSVVLCRVLAGLLLLVPSIALADDAVPVSAPAASAPVASAPVTSTSASAPASAGGGPARKIGRVTGLPLPRYVSLKSRSVNMRVGPGTQYRIAWTYQRHGLPMRVVAEHGLWRKLADAEGTTGWVLHSLITGRRTAVVAPWSVDAGAPDRSPLVLARPEPGAERVAARLQAGLVVAVDRCERGWCAVKADGHEAWLPQRVLWGVDVGEVVR